nr:gamma-glutamyltransferase [Cesiribacter andamanensis]
MISNLLMMLTKYAFSLLFLLLFGCREPDLLERGLVTEQAMVVSAHPLASAVGTEILRRGGNAADAAVATEFALAVVYPDAGNIGGGGFLVLRFADGTTDALDYRETAPAAAHRDMYLGRRGEVQEELSLKGHLAAGVPGTVDGMMRLHDRYGTLPWAELLQPAIELAERGFPLTRKEAKKLNQYHKDFVRYNTRRPEFVLRGRWRTGDTLRLPELAHTLRLIRDKGRAGFYEGETAENIVAEMERGGGIITKEDLLNYKALWRTPLTGHYKDYTIIAMPPPSSGGISLLQLLTISEQYPLAEWGWHTAQTAHLMIEAERRVYADRSRHLGDPDFWEVPVEGLLSREYILERMGNVDLEKASSSDAIYAGEPQFSESPNTTHYSIVDAQGNAVSATTTLNSTFGSLVFVDGSGFLLNNQMDDFSAKPGVPNQYGLLGEDANAIAPGKRMLSSMTPTILEKDGKLFMVVGSMGGSTIITTVYQIILNVVEHDLSMQGAVSAGRYHHQWKPDVVLSEWNSYNSGTYFPLLFKGHTLVPRFGTIGRAAAILVLPDGRLEGGADPRGDDAADGF